jgi:hypothetical protein
MLLQLWNGSNEERRSAAFVAVNRRLWAECAGLVDTFATGGKRAFA